MLYFSNNLLERSGTGHPLARVLQGNGEDETRMASRVEKAIDEMATELSPSTGDGQY